MNDHHPTATSKPAGFDPEVLARAGHGAIEVDLPTRLPLMVMLAGPIKHWWSPGQWGTPEHERYVSWRDAVLALIIREGHLVYCAHTAWRGAWTETAQQVNDAAVMCSHVLVDLTPPGTPAEGTAAEVGLARTSNTQVIGCPPGQSGDLEALALQLGRIHAELNGRTAA